jgi:hypothetical protein
MSESKTISMNQSWSDIRKEGAHKLNELMQPPEHTLAYFHNCLSRPEEKKKWLIKHGHKSHSTEEE